MKPTISMAVALALLGAVAPTTTAAEAFDLDAWAEYCTSEAEAVGADFAQHPDGVPQSVVFEGTQRIYAACYATLPVPATAQAQTRASPVGGAVDVKVVGDLVGGGLTGLLDGDKKICSGNTATIMGWSDTITVLGIDYPLKAGPASSDMTFYETSDDDVYGVGYLRSQWDDIAVAQNGGVWFFANIPMAGSLSLEGGCVGPLLYNLDGSATGAPLIWAIQPESIQSAIPHPLTVSANGSLCFPVC